MACRRFLLICPLNSVRLAEQWFLQRLKQHRDRPLEESERNLIGEKLEAPRLAEDIERNVMTYA